MLANSSWRRMPSPSVTTNELLEILTAHTAGYYVLPLQPYDEVYPGIVIGDSTTALCLHLLKRLGITHVLNAAWGKQRNLGMVNTSATYYSSANIEFMGIEALDMTVYPLYPHFHSAAAFIDSALQQSGKVLVHCGEGISRSSTLVLAFLMLKRGFKVKDAVRQVVKHRNILPNQGFLLQLCQLHDQLYLPSPSLTRIGPKNRSSFDDNSYRRSASPNLIPEYHSSSASRRCLSSDRASSNLLTTSPRYTSSLMSSYLGRPTITSSLH